MTVMDSNRLVNDYLEGLDRAAQSLPAERREELLADVRSHIAESGATTEADVRNVLERLGTPEEIVAGYEDTQGPPPPPAESRLRFHEYAALALLPFGGFLFIVGWFFGVMLLWTSNRWRIGEKVLGTLVLPFGYLSLVIIGMLPGQTCSEVSTSTPTRVGGPNPAGDPEVIESCSGFAIPAWIGIPLLVVLLIAPVVMVAFLAYRAAPNRARRSTASALG